MLQPFILSNFQPIQLREDVPAQKQRIEKLGVYHSDAGYLKEIVTKAIQFEKGLYAARDVGRFLILYLFFSRKSVRIHLNVVSDYDPKQDNCKPTERKKFLHFCRRRVLSVYQTRAINSTKQTVSSVRTAQRNFLSLASSMEH